MEDIIHRYAMRSVIFTGAALISYVGGGCKKCETPVEGQLCTAIEKPADQKCPTTVPAGYEFKWTTKKIRCAGAACTTKEKEELCCEKKLKAKTVCSKAGTDKDKECVVEKCATDHFRVKPITADDDGCLAKCTKSSATERVETNACACVKSDGSKKNFCDVGQTCFEGECTVPTCAIKENKFYNQCMYGSTDTKDKYCEEGVSDGKICVNKEIGNNERATEPSICKVVAYKRTNSALSNADKDKIALCNVGDLCTVSSTAKCAAPTAEVKECLIAELATEVTGNNENERKARIFNCKYGTNQYCGNVGSAQYAWDIRGVCLPFCTNQAKGDVTETCVCHNHKHVSDKKNKFTDICNPKGKKKCDPAADTQAGVCTK